LKEKDKDKKREKDESLLFALRNWIRFHILGKNPLCPYCKEEMVQKGFPKFTVHFKCLNCGYGAG